MTANSRIRRAMVAMALTLLVSACASLGDFSSFDQGTAGEPPRASGPIPASFTAYVENLWPAAEARGVSRRTFDQAFAGVGPDQDVLDRAARQAEFVKPLWEYLDSAVSDTRIATGQRMLVQYRPLLDQIERTYGVQRQVVVAIWGMESTYGEILGNPKVVKNVVRALATLAWNGGRRADFGRKQLLAVLAILEHGDIDARHMTGSWAGAMGHTQFIPTTYQAYAVDFDGDGRRDIWTSIPDALASTANYLRKSGWRPGEAWGYEVVLPAGFDARRADTAMEIRDWQALGITRANGQGFPRGDDKATLMLPVGVTGPAFLTLPNFNAIKRYNNANAYAFGVGHLADRLAGGGPILGQWPRTYQPLFQEAERRELQSLLIGRGYDVGGLDGKLGSATVAAIRSYQASIGVPVDGNPSQEVLALLRSGR